MSNQNTLYTGDNLYILNGFDSESFDLIYLDPPFNKNRNFSAPVGSQAAGNSFKDMWTWEDVDKSYLNELVENYPHLVRFIESIGIMHSKAMKSYVTYMTLRIIELHRVLKKSGAFYLHCDPTASHYLKLVCDRIFNKNNFRNEIIWKRVSGAGKSSQHKAKKWGASSDTILFYSKSKSSFVMPYRDFTDDEIIKKFDKVDENGERYYDDSNHIFRPKGLGDRPNLCYEWRGFENPNPSGWTLSKKRLEEEYQKGNFVILENGKRLQRRKYLKNHKGYALNNIWDDIPTPSKKERTGYPTQKPLKLLKRIISSSSMEGDRILDPFCGCATACVAAEDLGRNWVGIDISPTSAQLVASRIHNDAGLFTDFNHIDCSNGKNYPVRSGIIKIKKHDAKEILYKEQKGICAGCKVNFLIQNFTVDHIIPKSKGGPDALSNYQLLCGNCNSIKGNRPMAYLQMKIDKNKELMKLKNSFGSN